MVSVRARVNIGVGVRCSDGLYHLDVPSGGLGGAIFFAQATTRLLNAAGIQAQIQCSGSARTGSRVTAVISNSALGLNAPLDPAPLLANSEWYRDISAAAVHAQSATYLATLGTQVYSQDAGGWVYQGSIVGIPYFVVAGFTQPFVPVVCGQYLDESEVCWAPLPLRDDVVEGYPGNALYPNTPTDADRHLIVIDRDHRVIYELYRAYRRVDHWYCSNMAIWDMDAGDEQRPADQTSADVAGMSVMAGLLQGHQVTTDAIDHAVRFTIQHQCPNYLLPPAAHASAFGNASAVPFGGRLRLKASTSEVSKPGGGAWNPYALRIVRALKKFGMINADTGLALSPQGDTSVWDDGGGTGGPAWQDLRLLQTSDFEVVNTGATSYASGTPPTGTPPTATLTASATEVNSGAAVTLTPGWTGKTAAWLTPVGFVQKTPAPVVDHPTRDAFYQLEVINTFGRTRALKRVIVTNGPHRYAAYDRYVSPSGSTANTGLNTGSAWPITVLNDPNFRYLIAGQTIGVLDGTYDLSALTSTDYDYPLIEIPSGFPGKPTVVQAVNSRGAIISTGANSKAAMGSRYQGLSFIEFRGLKFTTTAANYNLYFTSDGGFIADDCEFSGFVNAAIRIARASCAFIRGCVAHNGAASYLSWIDLSSDIWMRGNTEDVPSNIWNDYGSNSNITVG